MSNHRHLINSNMYQLKQYRERKEKVLSSVAFNSADDLFERILFCSPLHINRLHVFFSFHYLSTTERKRENSNMSRVEHKRARTMQTIAPWHSHLAVWLVTIASHVFAIVRCLRPNVHRPKKQPSIHRTNGRKCHCVVCCGAVALRRKKTRR